MIFSQLLDKFKIDLVKFESINFIDLGLPFYTGKQLLTYCTDEKHYKIALSNPSVSGILVDKTASYISFEDKKVISSTDPKRSFWLIHEYLYENSFYHKKIKSKISTSAIILGQTYIAPTDVIIEDNVRLYPGAVILENSIIRKNSIIGPNVTIGIEGTQINHDGDRKYRASHSGGVLIKQNTYIGASSVITGSLFKRPTEIGENISIGNLVNIGHNCTIEDDVQILSQAVICGSSIIRKGARVSPNAVVSSSLELGENCQVKLGAVVVENIVANNVVSGNFAIDHKKFLRHYTKLKR